MRHRLDEGPEDVIGDATADALVQFNEGELGCSVDANAKVELVLRGMNLVDIKMNVANREKI